MRAIPWISTQTDIWACSDANDERPAGCPTHTGARRSTPGDLPARYKGIRQPEYVGPPARRRQCSEAIVKEAPTFVKAHISLGDGVLSASSAEKKTAISKRAIVERLNRQKEPR